MTPLRARSLLAVLLVFGQVAGLLHGLEHIGQDRSDPFAVAANASGLSAGEWAGATHADHVEHANHAEHAEHATHATHAEYVESEEHVDVLCGFCLLASAGIALVDTASAVPHQRGLRGHRSLLAYEDAPSDQAAYSHWARGPPAALS